MGCTFRRWSCEKRQASPFLQKPCAKKIQARGLGGRFRPEPSGVAASAPEEVSALEAEVSTCKDSSAMAFSNTNVKL